MAYFLGIDVGSSKSHACIADETGRVVGFGKGGRGNHESVGYEGLKQSLTDATTSALADAGLSKGQLAGAGFGIAGFDWETERPAMLEAIGVLGLTAPLEIVNDATLGIIAGATDGWGLAIVSGTGCNCRGRTRDGAREGMVTGAGQMMGEGAGASELVQWAIQEVARMWTKRGPATRLADVFVERAGARNLEDLLEGLINQRYVLRAAEAPVIFEVAAGGDPVAQELIRRTGTELGEMANAVIRQLRFEDEQFDVVLVGSMFHSGEALAAPLRETVLPVTPGARFVRLSVPPVVGAALLGMEQGGRIVTPAVRERLNETVRGRMAGG